MMKLRGMNGIEGKSMKNLTTKTKSVGRSRRHKRIIPGGTTSWAPVLHPFGMRCAFGGACEYGLRELRNFG
ncbi:MAG: hypothetical protein V1929_05805 [bacterium]